MFNWYTSLAKSERATLWACYGGWALDSMDLYIYNLMIPTLLGVMAMTRGSAGLIATAALFSSAFGGWFAGMVSDRFGRVRILQISIIWYSIFTFLCAFAQNFEQLLILRTIQGVGFGAEWAVGSILVGETITARHRGKAVGLVQSGYGAGWAVAGLIFAVCFSLFAADQAWRVMFAMGLLPALLVLATRRSLVEPPSQALASNGMTSFRRIFTPPLLKVTVLCSLLSVGIQGGAYTVIIWLPSYLQSVRGLSVINTTAYLEIYISGAICGYIVSGYLNDWLGRRYTFMFFAVTSFALVLCYTLLPISNAAMLVLGFPLGFFPNGIYSGLGPTFTELFPSGARGSGQGFSYNFGRAVGAVFPALVGFLSSNVPLAWAMAAFSSSCYVLVCIIAWILPETAGSELDFKKGKSVSGKEPLPAS